MECMLQTPQRTFRSASMLLILTATHLIPLFRVYLKIFLMGRVYSTLEHELSVENHTRTDGEGIQGSSSSLRRPTTSVCPVVLYGANLG